MRRWARGARRALLVLAPILVTLAGALAAGAVIADVRGDARRESEAATVTSVYAAQWRLVSVILDEVGAAERRPSRRLPEDRLADSPQLRRVLVSENDQRIRLEQLVAGTAEGDRLLATVNGARADAFRLVFGVTRENIRQLIAGATQVADALDAHAVRARSRAQVADDRAQTVTAVALVSGVVLAGAAWLAFVVVTNRLRRRHIAALRRLADHDPLTGLGNRRALERTAERLDGQPAVLVICDLDGFKAFNDRFGHPAGDALLQRLAERLERASSNAGGHAYRIGGDEFCVLQPGAGADAVRERCRAVLREEGDGYVIGASAGAAQLPAEAATLDVAWRVADARLYEAKREHYRAQPGADRRAPEQRAFEESA